MKKQNSLFSIRSAVLLLVLSLILVSGYGYAQTQFAYTTGFNTRNVTEIRTSDNSERRSALVGTVGTPQGIALTDDGKTALVAITQCSVPFNPCVSRIDISAAALTVTNLTVNYPAQFVAITPPLAAAQGCRLAYVTSLQQALSVINVCNNNVSSNTSLPSGTLTYGVAVAAFPNGPTEVWVTDSVQANHRVFAINPSNGNTEQIPLMCPDGCQPPICCPGANPAPRHIAYVYVSSNEFRMYVTDGAPGNQAVWMITNTVSNGQVVSRTAGRCGEPPPGQVILDGGDPRNWRNLILPPQSPRQNVIF